MISYDETFQSMKRCLNRVKFAYPRDSENACTPNGSSRRNEPTSGECSRAARSRGRAPEHGVERNNTLI